MAHWREAARKLMFSNQSSALVDQTLTTVDPEFRLWRPQQVYVA